MNDPILGHDQRHQCAVILVFINAVDTLFLNAANAGREATTQYGKGSKVYFGVAMGVGEMLFERQVTFSIEKAI